MKRVGRKTGTEEIGRDEDEDGKEDDVCLNVGNSVHLQQMRRQFVALVHPSSPTIK
jgi:hypothetical protein